MSKKALKLQEQYARENRIRTTEDIKLYEKQDRLNPNMRLITNGIDSDDTIYYCKVEVFSGGVKSTSTTPYCNKNKDHRLIVICKECGFKLMKIDKVVITALKEVGKTLID